MKSTVYDLFSRLFPQFGMDEDTFCRLTDIDNCEIFADYENHTVRGCAVVYKNCIRLICVHPDFRGRGIGRSLMETCESHIKSNGYKKAVIGGHDSNLFIGAVTPEEDWKDSRHPFFEKLGYRSDDRCLEMKMKLDNFDLAGLDIPKCPDNVTFGYIYDDRREELQKAVAAVDEDWVQYFDFRSPVFAAQSDGKIVGFCIPESDTETIISTGKNNVGMVGCVGVVPEFREKGIGLAMTANAVHDLQQKGSDEIFIHYTYLDWWYGRLGFRTFLWYLFAEKEL